MSFAGQQDTFLNVLGEEPVMKAVVNCWSSLWTARAIGYRHRNGVPHASVSLAVVVQIMVPSQASGVLFTANPLSGLRSETVIDAILGLGEALVSGQVEPDHYVVDPLTQEILSKSLGSKAVQIHGLPGGGTQTVQQTQAERQALPDDQILALASLGRQVAELFGFPQDIEWAWNDGRLHLLQSRPVTALFPLPANMPAEPLKVLFSIGAVQGMLDPFTPLGQQALIVIFAGGAGMFGVHTTRHTQSILYVAGERLWANFTPVISNSLGRRILPYIFNQVEPSTRQALDKLWDDPRLQPTHAGLSRWAVSRLAHFLPFLGVNILKNLASPERRRKTIIENGESILDEIEKRRQAIQGDRWQMLRQHVNLFLELPDEFLNGTLILFISGVASGISAWNILNKLARNRPSQMTTALSTDQRDLLLQITRGMPHNSTTEMDLALWELAKIIRSDPELLQFFQSSSPSELAEQYLQGRLSIHPTAAQALDRFIARYAGRGFAEIDLGRPRWGEDPTHVFEMLSSFLQIADASLAPDAVFTRSAQSAEEAVSQLIVSIRKSHLGWLKAPLARFFAGRARALMGLRESPKFFAVRLMYLIRLGLLQSGQDFVQAGELDRPDDFFYMTFDEILAFAEKQPGDWHSLVVSRRETYQRELQRRQIPRLLLSDGRAFYEGMAGSPQDGNFIPGSPVSPGSVEGLVRVVLDPRHAGLLPGEILVCPGTDPSWTPLFLSAAGLVMEVGGMMTHGAVVAREYGIPAIVGVDQATTRLHTGQRIRLDGSSGNIVLLE
jgi:pyruvate,water dikinase